MNTSATSAASRAEYDALDANSARSPDYLPTCSSFNSNSSYLLPPVAEDAVSIFTFKSAVRRRPLPYGALHARSARGGLL